jgi:thiol:disulfide interchange protein DsbD
VSNVIGGAPFDLIVELKLREGWHTYWHYPGDAGFPPTVVWSLPPGWSAGPLEFSLPEKFSESGNTTIYGYEKVCFLKSTITPARSLAASESFQIEGTLSWLACRESCVPGSSHFSLILPSAVGGEASRADLLSSSKSEAVWPTPGAPPFRFSLVAEGGSEKLSFEGVEGSRYEFFPDPPAETKIKGEITTQKKGRDYVITIPWTESASFRGLLVETKKEGAKTGWWIAPELPQTALPSAKEIADLQPITVSSRALLIAILCGFLGGLILNLMPCVLPVISLKIFGFIAQAGQSRHKILAHGLAFIAGIYLWFLGLALLIIILKSSGSQVTWAFQFQNPLFLILISSAVFLFALNLFGLFETVLPGSASNSLDRLSSREGYLGSFFQGLFATLLATPCTAPFLGSALGFAFAQSGGIIVVIFFSIATGMALPYFLLSLYPAWLKWIPRRGPWMEHLKQFMGFPLLATNIWLLGVIGREHGTSGVILTLVLLLSLGVAAWIYGLFCRAERGVRWGGCSLSLLLALLALWRLTPQIISSARDPVSASQGQIASRTPAASDTIEWVPYSKAGLDKLRSKGAAVFLDFTAAWCLTCQFNERTAINTPAVKKLLRDYQIVPMRADWTDADPEITAALRQFHRVGVPFYVYYPPGVKSEPLCFSELLFERALVHAFSNKQ